MRRLFCLLALTFVASSAYAQRFNLGMATCKGSFQPSVASYRRQVFFEGQGFSLWNSADRYDQLIYDMNEYAVLTSGVVRGERKGSSNFNEFHYVVEVSPKMVKLWENSTPHYNRVKITHFAECVLDRPMNAQRFEDLKRQVL